MAFLILLAVVGFLAYRLTSSEQREHYLHVAIALGRQLIERLVRPGEEYTTFRDTLKIRTSILLATPAFLLISVGVFGGMLFGATPIGNADTLVAWGASVGTRTTNGEWWRLATAIFVHTGLLHLLVCMAALSQLGGFLERLTGHLTFIAAYLFAGIFTGLANLSHYPVAVTISSTGAIFGLYGLLAASLIWQVFHGLGAQSARLFPLFRSRAAEGDSSAAEEEQPLKDDTQSRIVIPPIALKRLGVGAALFFLYSTFSGHLHNAELSGLLVGLACGMVLGRRVDESVAEPKHVAFTAAATAVMALVCAFALRNIADVKPEIARLVATEERTATAYRAGVDAFNRGRMSADALAQLAEGTIMPELQAADARLKGFDRVPQEHQPLLADAREYLRLRCVSWRARANAIRKVYKGLHQAPEGPPNAGPRLQAEARFRSNLAALGAAEGAERASLEAFQKMRTTNER